MNIVLKNAYSNTYVSVLLKGAAGILHTSCTIKKEREHEEAAEAEVHWVSNCIPLGNTGT